MPDIVLRFPCVSTVKNETPLAQLPRARILPNADKHEILPEMFPGSDLNEGNVEGASFRLSLGRPLRNCCMYEPNPDG